MRHKTLSPCAVILGIAVTVLGFGRTTMANDIFVNNVEGNDTASGRMPGLENRALGPVQTIDRALRITEPDDRIVLINTGKPYKNSISLVGKNCSGTEENPFTIVGNGATLDGTKLVPKNAWKRFQSEVFRFQPPRAGFQTLYRDGKPVPRALVTGNSLPRLEPGQWCLFGPSIYFRVEKNRMPEDYDLAYTQFSTGITLMYVRNVVIQDITIQGYRLDGISAVNNAHGVKLIRVVARGNGRSGVSVGNMSEVEIKDSLIGDNGKAQVLTLPRSKTKIVGTQILENTAPAFDQQGGELILEEKTASPQGSTE